MSPSSKVTHMENLSICRTTTTTRRIHTNKICMALEMAWKTRPLQLVLCGGPVTPTPTINTMRIQWKERWKQGSIQGPAGFSIKSRNVALNDTIRVNLALQVPALYAYGTRTSPLLCLQMGHQQAQWSSLTCVFLKFIWLLIICFCWPDDVIQKARYHNISRQFQC